jgi:lysylphosphatidylglycerol synthetase-like protein (DUF2156 family)
VEELLKAHGQSSVGAFALSDADYFFSRNGRAVIAYRFESDTLLGIGDRSARPRRRTAAQRLRRLLRRRGLAIRLFQARPEWLPLYRERGWRAIHIGEDPVPDRKLHA